MREPRAFPLEAEPPPALGVVPPVPEARVPALAMKPLVPAQQVRAEPVPEQVVRAGTGEPRARKACQSRHKSPVRFCPLVSTSGSSAGSVERAIAYARRYDASASAGLSEALADDAQIVERVGEIGMCRAELRLLQRGGLAQVLLR